VEFKYLTFLDVDDGKYKFLLPTNIAPRYSPKQVEILNSPKVLSYSSNVPYMFTIKLNWKSNSKITFITSLTNEKDIIIEHISEFEKNINCTTIPSKGDFTLLLDTTVNTNLY
jgi:hypothetical protein